MSATAEILALPTLTKRCPRCEETKPRGEFYVAKVKKDGCSTYCKPCDNWLRVNRYRPVTRVYDREYQKQKWRGFSPEEKRTKVQARFERHLWATHRMNIADARMLLAKQGGLCGNRACGQELSLDVHGRKDWKNRAVIDHCHKTGKVRGILCNHCNKAEGFYEKNKNLFLGIAEYLARSEA